MAVLFIPLIFGLHDLYPWSRPEIVSADAILQKKHLYLNTTAFVVRGIFYFVVWLTMALCLRRWSVQQDATSARGAGDPDANPERAGNRGLSAHGHVCAGGLDHVDGTEVVFNHLSAVIVIIGQILSALAFITLLLAWVAAAISFSGRGHAKMFSRSRQSAVGLCHVLDLRELRGNF